LIPKHKTVALIPARGGSKGVPGKNIINFLGSPLISWTIKAAKAAKSIDQIVVSTDSAEIAGVAEACGVSVPSLRSPELSDDTSLVSAVAIDYLRKAAEEGTFYDNLILLEPTSPLRMVDDLDSMINLLENNPKVDAVVSFTRVRQSPSYVHLESKEGLAKPLSGHELDRPRQSFEPLIYPNGVGYVIRVSALMRERTFYPLKTKPFMTSLSQGYEIDEPIDLLIMSTLGMQEEYKWLS